jgi:predicted dehydrogenase
MGQKVTVGIIGCGNISGAYIKGCRQFEILEVAACADIDREKAERTAEAHAIPKAYPVADLLADPAVDMVLNLTIPAAHAEVSLAAIESGKHVYSEKPLALTTGEGRAILETAARRQLRVGCAPDTFLGGALQTCRKLIDDGWIGEPVAATAFMMGGGPESWHPNPAFFYQEGAGPLFDMGPYYLTALVHLLGPIARVTAAARISFPERVATSEARFGERIPVSVPTHVAGLLDFAAGPVGTLITSFDIKGGAQLPRIEIYGSQGSLSVPDPNYFGGPVRLRRAGGEEWQEIPLTHSADVSRGIGVADMAYGIAYGRAHRAGGELAFHVLEAMEALLAASAEGRHVTITSPCARPAALPMGLLAGRLDS